MYHPDDTKRSSGRRSSKHAGIPVLGAVPRQKKGEFPERHMGLTPFHEHPEVEQAIEAAAQIAEKHLDLKRLWEIAVRVPGRLPDCTDSSR